MHRPHRRGSVAALCAASAAIVGHAHAQVTIRGRTYAATFSEQTGGLQALRGAGASGPLVWSRGEPGLWVLRFRDGSTLTAADCTRPSGRIVVSRPTERTIRLAFEAPAASVTVDVSGADEHLSVRAAVTPRRGDVLALALPASLAAASSRLQRVVFPADMGISLKPGFYDRRSYPGSWTDVTLGADALRTVTGGVCLMGEANAAASELSVPDAGRRAMGAAAELWRGQRAHVSRPSADRPDIVLIDSPAGAFAGLHRVGAGGLVHFAGALASADEKAVLSTIEALVAASRARRPDLGLAPMSDRRTRVQVLCLDRGPQNGGWCGIRADAFRTRLLASAALRRAGLDVSVVRSVDDVAAAILHPTTIACVNPYGESLPCPAGGSRPVLQAARSLMSAGGLWIATGGWPFYMALTAAEWNHIESPYPGGYCDYGRVETTDGSVSLYGVQDSRDPAVVLVPSRWETAGTPDGPRIERRWQWLAPVGKTTETPEVRIAVQPPTEPAGSDVVGDIRAYAAANGIGRDLISKAPASVIERWKRSVITVFHAPTFREQSDLLKRVKTPAILHVSNYLHGGFDKELPDHLPPNPARGTMADMRAFVDQAHRGGHLVMPYANVTWWSDDPRGPTFTRQGEGSLLKGLDGARVRETYGANWGWSVTPHHADVRSAAATVTTQLVRDLGVDLLFQDQMGARSWIVYDTNAASPTPYAYSQGILGLSALTCAQDPCATENGFDRLANTQTMFCGTHWPLVPFEETPDWLVRWLRPYRDWLRDTDWEVFPMAQYCAHHCAFFSYHLGGPFVGSPATLGWALVLGYQMTYDLAPFAIQVPRVGEWFPLLDRLQKVLGPQYMGQTLTSFRYLSGGANTGVIEARYGNLRVVANMTPHPVADGDVEIAPWGFHAVSPSSEAGLLRRYNGTSYEAQPLWIVVDRSSGETSVSSWVREPTDVTVVAGGLARSVPAAALVTRSVDRFTLSMRPAPRPAPAANRPESVRIGVLSLSPDAPELYSWATIPAADWVRSLSGRRGPDGKEWIVKPIRDVHGLNDALAHPDAWTAIVNPYGEGIPTSGKAGTRRTSTAVARFVQAGGLWFETGGLPFYAALRISGGAWTRTPTGPDAMWGMGLSGPWIRASDDFDARLEATDLGAALLGPDWQRLVGAASAVVNRPLYRDDAEAVIVRTVDGRPYVVGHTLGGTGRLYRFCGVGPGATLAYPTVAGLIASAGAERNRTTPVRSVPAQLVTVRLVR